MTSNTEGANLQKEAATTRNIAVKAESKEDEQISNSIDTSVAKNASIASPSKTPNSTSSQVQFCFLLVHVQLNGVHRSSKNYLTKFFVRILCIRPYTFSTLIQYKFRMICFCDNGNFNIRMVAMSKQFLIRHYE